MDSWTELDLYGLIGVEQTATLQQIKKAYRKKALSCHPDKHPNNPKATELFHKLSEALEILTDTSARAAYDKVVNAKYQAKLRAKEFDSKRKKLKDDLEARENAYRSSNTDFNIKTDKDKLRTEIERLQKEGSKQVEEEIAFMKRDFEKRSKAFTEETEVESGSYRIKVKWKPDKSEFKNYEYNYDTLYQIFSKYGDIIALVVSSAKEGRALVEYQKRNDAEMALKIELGFAQNPLKLQKLWDTRKESTSFATRVVHSDTDLTKNVVNQSTTEIEFEHYVLNNLKRAEEKKRSLHTLKSI